MTELIARITTRMLQNANTLICTQPTFASPPDFPDAKRDARNENANARRNMSLVLAPRLACSSGGHGPTVTRLSAPLSPPLSSAGGRGGEKGERHPGHDDTAPEEIIDPDTPPRQHYAQAAL